jgi:hypothetical protein
LYIIAIVPFKCGGREEIGEKTTLPPHWLVDHMSPAEAGNISISDGLLLLSLLYINYPTRFAITMKSICSVSVIAKLRYWFLLVTQTTYLRLSYYSRWRLMSSGTLFSIPLFTAGFAVCV